MVVGLGSNNEVMDDLVSIGGGLVGILLFFVIWIGLFLIFRAVVLWYFKIDKQVTLMTEQNRLLREIDKKLGKS